MKFTLDFLNTEFNRQFISYDLIYNGSDNNVYCLTDIDRKKYILRESLRIKNQDDLAFEANFSSFLSQRDIPVRLVLKTGSLSLLSFCEGKNLSFEMVTPTQCFNGGKTLAQFHLMSQQFHQLPFPKRTLTSELERVSAVSDKLIQRYSNGAAFIKNVNKILSSPILKQKNTCVIHNDFRIQNVLFDGDTLSAILDFDWACLGNPLKDLAHAMAEWSILDGNPICQDRFAAFLNGYKSVCSNIDYEELQFWACFGCLADAATYLVDRIDQPQPFGEIRSWMYSKYLFFKENDIKKFLK